MPHNILKLEYRRSFFDLNIRKSYLCEVITVTNDGTIICKEYKFGVREAHSIQKTKCSVRAFNNLCSKILDCIETADRNDFFVDDSSAELKIYHEFGRVQTMDRGLGNGNTYIEYIMQSFFEKYLK